MPMAAISSATDANRASRIAFSRGCAALSDTHRSHARDRQLGIELVRLPRTPARIDSGGASVRTTMSISSEDR
jgi:hypothetical protein